MYLKLCEGRGFASLFCWIHLLKKVDELKTRLKMTEDAQQLEIQTKRSQANCALWFEARRFRLTASNLGRVKQLKSQTHPDNTVLSILGVKTHYGKQLEYGKHMEKTTLEDYIKQQHQNGHHDLYVIPSGLIVSFTHLFLAATPDAAVCDPSSTNDPFGFAEIKCT